METPNELKPAGKRLWESVTDDFELDEHEATLLLQAARIADRLDVLDRYVREQGVMVLNERDDLVPHPAMIEARQQSQVLMRLLASLRLPSGEETDGALKRPQRRGSARGSYGIRGSVG